MEDQMMTEARRLARARIRYTKSLLSRQARQLGQDLVQLADEIDEEDYPSINPFGVVGDSGRLVDQLATRYDAELSALSCIEELSEKTAAAACAA